MADSSEPPPPAYEAPSFDKARAHYDESLPRRICHDGTLNKWHLALPGI